MGREPPRYTILEVQYYKMVKFPGRDISSLVVKVKDIFWKDSDKNLQDFYQDVERSCQYFLPRGMTVLNTKEMKELAI